MERAVTGITTKLNTKNYSVHQALMDFASLDTDKVGRLGCRIDYDLQSFGGAQGEIQPEDAPDAYLALQL